MLVIDRNLMMVDGVEKLVNFLNEKMVTDISYSAMEYKNEFGVEYTNLSFKVKTLHMGAGILTEYFPLGNLQTWNANVIIENIMNIYK